MQSNKDVKILEVSTSGIQTKTTLIETGVTIIDGGIVDRNSKIHVHEVDLVISDAATITLYLGDTAIYERTLTASGEVHSTDRDIFLPSNANNILSISVSANVTVSGRIFFTREFTGGKKLATV